jgi:CRISPR-associated protein Csy1
MTEENKIFENWEEVILSFLEKKKESEEEKYLKEKIKNIANAFESKKYFGDEEIRNFFDPKKNKKEKNQSALDFQKGKLEKIFSFKQQPDAIDLKKIKEDYQDKRNEINDKFLPYKWISEAAQKAASVSFATHVIKLTHSKIDSPSFYDLIDAQRMDVLTTSNVRDKIIDGAVSGNQFAPIHQFLELDFNGQKLASTFKDETNEILKPFAQTREELINWNKGFSKSLRTDYLSSHSLAKQVYFYDEEKKQYHLLCHVKSSSLAHALFEKIVNDNQLAVKKLREKSKFSEQITEYFPQKANISVTASNHSNASQLNGRRGGKLYLFSCQPPTWQNQLKQPIYSQSFFYAVFLDKSTITTLDYLHDFLLRHQHIDLSIKAPERRKWIDQWVNDIIDEILAYAAAIQNLEPGWSATDNIKLKTAHQYFLDPYRDDEAFQTARTASDWQATICNDFAKWLNYKLMGKDKKFTPQQTHSRIWVELLEQPLREHNNTIEANFPRKENP